MKPLMLAVTVLVLSMAPAVYAQQPTTPPDTPGKAPAAAAGMPMVEMCRTMMTAHAMPGGGQPMMGGGMGMMGGGHDMMGGMGMMGGGDPKMMASMMEMRGEMMKAMGDIMLRHAKRMQQLPPAAK